MSNSEIVYSVIIMPYEEVNFGSHDFFTSVYSTEDNVIKGVVKYLAEFHDLQFITNPNTIEDLKEQFIEALDNYLLVIRKEIINEYL